MKFPGENSGQKYKTDTDVYVVGRRHLYTSLVVTIETNGEVSEVASVSCHAEFVDTVSPLWLN